MTRVVWDEEKYTGVSSEKQGTGLPVTQLFNHLVSKQKGVVTSSFTLYLQK